MESSAERRERFHPHFFHRVGPADIDPQGIHELAHRAALEDLEGAGFRQTAVKTGDPTSSLFLDPDGSVSAVVRARETLCPAGLAFAPSILDGFDPSLNWESLLEDGGRAEKDSALARISGPPKTLFTAERTLLNFLQFLSGIATTTRCFVDLLGDSPTRLLDTRKTLPGYRALSKYAVAQGGGWNHRLGLYDRIMLKDNHLGAGKLVTAGDFSEAVERARSQRPDLPIQIEIDRLDQLDAVRAAEPDAILLDNFRIDDLREAVARVGGQCLTEASGGVTETTLPDLASIGLDFISTGATVHQSRWVDIGLDLE